MNVRAFKLREWVSEGHLTIWTTWNSYGFEVEMVSLLDGTVTDCMYHFPSEVEFAKVALAVKAGQ